MARATIQNRTCSGSSRRAVSSVTWLDILVASDLGTPALRRCRSSARTVAKSRIQQGGEFIRRALPVAPDDPRTVGRLQAQHRAEADHLAHSLIGGGQGQATPVKLWRAATAAIP